jgi:hypothetical protein
MNSSPSIRTFLFSASLGLPLLVAACGGGGGSTSSTSSATTTSNQLAITVEQNPDVTAIEPTTVTTDVPYATVTVCDASNNCQSIPHVTVDTGSYGLRLLQSALTSVNLPLDTTSSGQDLAECEIFGSGYTWGGVAHAVIKLAGETTSSIPIEIIGAPGLPSAPAACTAKDPTDAGSISVIHSNGILGVGPMIADRGDYFSCTSSACTPLSGSSTPATSAMVSNPVAFFSSSDTNGIVFQLPAVSASGAAATSGTVTFGVGTQSDNSISGYTVIPLDNVGHLMVQVGGKSYVSSYLDSGSSLYVAPFNVPYNTSTDYFSPSSLQQIPIVLTSNSGSSTSSYSSSVDLASPASLSLSPSLVAFDDIGIYSTSTTTVDLGLPFFFGKTIAYVFNGMSSSAGTGPLNAIAP